MFDTGLAEEAQCFNGVYCLLNIEITLDVYPRFWSQLYRFKQVSIWKEFHSQQKDCCTGFKEVAWSLGLRAQDPVQTDPCKINIHYSPLRPLKDVKNPECFDARYVYLIRVEGGYSFWATGNNVEREIWPLGYGHEVTSDSAVHRFSSSVVAV